MTPASDSSGPIEVSLTGRSPERFAEILDADHYAAFERGMRRARELFEGRVFWHVNSTARGGGVAEMLQSLVPYFRGSGVDCRWVVIEGNDRFFRVTKRLHNNLHGELGDGGDLGDAEQQIYESALEANAQGLVSRLRRGDLVFLHDPQTAGLAQRVREAGAAVVWRCHVGLDTPNDIARRAWDFLRPYVDEAHAFVFSRQAFAWERIPEGAVSVIPPSIDAFSPKNQDLSEQTVNAILSVSGLLEASSSAPSLFSRENGTPGRVDRHAELIGGLPPPSSSAKLVVQLSRWDRLKDPVGVVEGFARYVAGRSDAHLVVAGPAVSKVADDPEGKNVLEQASVLWDELPEQVRRRVHLAVLPMDDIQENAAIANALQRRADVVVQKSLAEGFGLTVSEAMWKARPVVASRIGGIQDQIVDGTTGLLIGNPADLMGFGEAVVELLEDKDLAVRMGENGRQRVRDKFLDPRHLLEHADLAEKLMR
jgi:trehalose synthase